MQEDFHNIRILPRTKRPMTTREPHSLISLLSWHNFPQAGVIHVLLVSTVGTECHSPSVILAEPMQCLHTVGAIFIA